MNQAASVTSLADWASGEGKEVSSISLSINKESMADTDVTGGCGDNSAVNPCHPRRDVLPQPNEGLGGGHQLAHGQRWVH